MNDNFSFYDTDTGYSSVPLEFNNTPIALPAGKEFTPITPELIREILEDVSGGKKKSMMTARRLFFSRYIEAMDKKMKESGEVPDDKEAYEHVKEILLRENETSMTEKYDLLYLLNKMVEHEGEIGSFIKIFPLYFHNIRGYIVFPADFFVGAVKSAPALFRFGPDVYKYLFERFLGEMLASREFRMKSAEKLQRIRIELEDFSVGVSSEYDVVTDVKCWKLWTLVDEESSLNSYVDLELSEEKLKVSVHGTLSDGTVVDVSEEELTDVSKDLLVMEETKVPGLEYDNCIFLSEVWKRDFDILFPVIVEFLAFEHDDREIHIESLMDNLRVVLANKILLTHPKCRQLTEQCMGPVLQGDKLDLLVKFIEIIFTVDPETHTKNCFFDDIQIMLNEVNLRELMP
jgi:hypothetical protein